VSDENERDKRDRRVANPVPELARIFGLSNEDAYCLAVYVAASDETLDDRLRGPRAVAVALQGRWG
jgi:hypothetical protein